MQTVKIKSTENLVTKIFVGDSEIKRVRNVEFSQSFDTVPCFTFETMGFPDIEIDNADIRFKFTPETVADAAKVIRHSFFTDNELYNAFVTSIESAIHDNGVVCDLGDQHNLAVEIADRIIGREE